MHHFIHNPPRSKFTNVECLCKTLKERYLIFALCTAVHTQLTQNCSHIIYLWQTEVTFTTPSVNLWLPCYYLLGGVRTGDAQAWHQLSCHRRGLTEAAWAGMTSPHVTAHTSTRWHWSQTGLPWHHPSDPATKKHHAEILQICNSNKCIYFSSICI